MLLKKVYDYVRHLKRGTALSACMKQAYITQIPVEPRQPPMSLFCSLLDQHLHDFPASWAHLADDLSESSREASFEAAFLSLLFLK